MDKVIYFSDFSKPYFEESRKEDKPLPECTHGDESSDLTFMPVYDTAVIKIPSIEAKSALNDFHEKYGKLKSAKLLEVIEKHCLPDSDVKVDLDERKKQYLREYDKLCLEVMCRGISGKEDMCKFLKDYIAEHGNYIESPHCALLIEDILKNKGVKSQIVCLKDSEGKIEHYFNVIGMDENANVKDPYTWGKKAIVCDAWANACVEISDVLDFYENLFRIEYGDYHFDYM